MRFRSHSKLWSWVALAIAIASASAIGTFGDNTSAKALKEKKGFTWITKSSANFDFYYEVGTPAERDIEKIMANMEKSRAHVETLLGGTFGTRTDAFLVDSRARMKQLVGEEGNGFAFGSRKMLVGKLEMVSAMVYSDTIKAIGAHETCHILALFLWGKAHGVWVNEGLAVYSDDQWQGNPLHLVAKVLLNRGKLLPIADLIDDGWLKKYPDMVTYPELGSFVKFLYEKYGMEAVKNLWQHGAKEAEGGFGKNIAALETEWRAELVKMDANSIQYKF